MKSNPILKRFGKNGLTAVLLGLFAVMVLSIFAPMPAHGQGQTALTHQMRGAVSNAQVPWLGHLPATQSMNLTIALPLRNEPELDQVLQQLYAPGSPMYHKFLSVQEFTDRFGPSQEDYDAVIGFAQANGFTVTSTAPNRLVVDVQGPVANIEAAFHVNMGVYQHPTENRTFYAPNREPTADLPFALWHITGLDNFSIPRPAAHRSASEAKSAPAVGSAPNGGGYAGSDMRAAYYGGTALTGSGQSIGLFEESPYNANDVTLYFSNLKQPLNVPVYPVSADGSSTGCTAATCGDAEVEVALDIEQAISMAPGMTQVRVYVGNSDASIFNSMATDGNTHNVKSLSCSWGWYPADTGSDEPYFKEFAAQGQSLFVASGDGGSFPDSAWPYYYPSESANVTAVGGTDLTTNGAGGPWSSETAWNDSGGGISVDKIPIPSWQQAAITALNNIATAPNKGSTKYRNVPDVAAEGNFDNYVCYSGNADGLGSGQHCEGGWGGTSFAAPRWAGYIALANQQRVTNGGSTVGFINPAIYTIGLGSSYATSFHDITSGSNAHGSNAGFSAEPGYDLVTGWGSPNGTGLIGALTVTLSATSGIVSSAGGPLSITVNAPTGYSWTAVSNNPSWITVASGASGTGNGTVQLSIPSFTGAKQTGTATIAGITYTVTQLSPQGSLPLAGSFGSQGLWVFQNAIWSQLKATSPVAMATYGPPPSNLVAGFPGDGLYQYNGTTLTKISSNGSVTTMLGLSNVIYVSLGNAGLWKWDGTNFTEVLALNATSMVYSSTSSLLYVNCPGYGVYSYDGVHTPIQITPAVATNMIVAGSTFYGDFGAAIGFWSCTGAGTNWTKIGTATSDILVVSGTTLYGDFGAAGVWAYNGTNWTQLTPAHANNLIFDGTTLYGDYGAVGIWAYNVSSAKWGSGPITPASSKNLVVAGTTLYGDFGAVYGIWQYSGAGTSWTQITPATSNQLLVSASVIDGTFGASGVWQWDNNSWTQLTSSNATQIIVFGN